MEALGSQGSLGRRARPVPRPAAAPGRLRALLTISGWGRKAEPQVRYGQRFLPGLRLLGPTDRAVAGEALDRAQGVRRRRFSHLGHVHAPTGPVEWEPHEMPEGWALELGALDDLFAVGIAGALSAPQARGGWYDVAIGLCGEWMEGNRRRQGVGWTVPSLVRRIPNLINTFAFFAPELRRDLLRRRVLLDGLYEQTAALAAAVPRASRDPDLVEAGRALFMAGRLFDGMEARAWLEAGVTTLWGQLREQVHDDGGHRSGNLAAHARVLGSYLDVLAVLHAANDDIPVWARKRVKGMAGLLARLLHPDREIPLLRGATLGTARPAPELLAMAAVLLHEPELAPPGDLPGMWPRVMLGEADRRVHVQLPRSTGLEPRALRRTGLYVLPGGPRDVMIFDGASPEPGGSAGCLGYELSIGGERVIVGSGIAADGDVPAEYFRSTRAHNVVSIDGSEQGMPGRVPVVSDLRWIVRDGLTYVAASHDGFARLALDLRLRYRRHVFCSPERYWVVCDELQGSGEHEAESFIHLHPDIVLRGACRDRVALRVECPGGMVARIVPAGVDEVRIVHGERQPRAQGWYAERRGRVRPASVVSLVVRGRLPRLFGYVVAPDVGVPIDLRLEHDAFGLAAVVRLGGEEHRHTVVQGAVESACQAIAS